MGNVAGFGIGTYQPISGGVQIGSGFPTGFGQLAHPYSGTYGGSSYGYVIDTTIKAPASVDYTPAPETGLDGIGNPVVRGFPMMQWNYTTSRPDAWYKFKLLYDQSARTIPGFQYLVLVQYPDPAGSGTLLRQLARMEPPLSSGRNVAVYQGIQLKFTYIGEALLATGTLITVLS